jgi:hypothetical protein
MWSNFTYIHNHSSGEISSAIHPSIMDCIHTCGCFYRYIANHHIPMDTNTRINLISLDPHYQSMWATGSVFL